jgi:Tfp pilus assembly protein PilE
MKKLDYRLYIVAGILGLLAMLVFAANSYDHYRAKVYIEQGHSQLVPINDSSK